MKFEVGDVIEFNPYHLKASRFKNVVEKAICFNVCRKYSHFIRENNIFYIVDNKEKYQRNMNIKIIGKFKENYDFDKDFNIIKLNSKRK